MWGRVTASRIPDGSEALGREVFLDGIDQTGVVRQDVGLPVLYKITAAIKQVLVKCPARQDRRRVLLKHFPKQWMHFPTGDCITLGHEEIDRVVLTQELGNFRVIARLFIEVIAWNSQYAQSCGLIQRVQCLQSAQLRHKQALGRDIDDNKRHVAVPVQIKAVALQIDEVMIEQIHGNSLLRVGLFLHPILQ